MKRSPIRRVSKKHSERMRKYYKIRKIHLEENPVCQVCWSAPSTVIGHKKGRLGDLLFDRTYFLAECGPCEMRVTQNPDWAFQNGYSLDRLAHD